jgi:hypothetical protein
MTLRSWLFWVVMQRMSVTWYQHSLLIYPEEQSPQLYGGGSLNIKMTFFLQVQLSFCLLLEEN